MRFDLDACKLDSLQRAVRFGRMLMSALSQSTVWRPEICEISLCALHLCTTHVTELLMLDVSASEAPRSGRAVDVVRYLWEEAQWDPVPHPPFTRSLLAICWAEVMFDYVSCFFLF